MIYEMTNKVKTTIEIPISLLAVIVSLLLAIFGWAVATSSAGATTNKQVEVNTELIKKLQEEKISKDSYLYIKEQLDELKKTTDRIEQKVDRHIMKDIK